MFFAKSRKELKIQNNTDYIYDNGYENATDYYQALNLDSTKDVVEAVKKSENLQVLMMGVVFGAVTAIYFKSFTPLVGGVILGYAVHTAVKLSRVLFIWNVKQRG